MTISINKESNRVLISQNNQEVVKVSSGIKGDTGPAGPTGPTGPGIATGGSVGDILVKTGAGDYVTGWTDAPTVDSMNFDTVNPDAGATGRLTWNDLDGTLDLGLKGGNVTVQLGEGTMHRVVNKSGADITRGQVVCVLGAQGQRVSVTLAQATTDELSSKTFGVAAETIANNGTGFVISEGMLRNFNTSTLTEGQLVWLSPSTPGGMTTTKVVAPDHLVLVGVCVSQGNNGILAVKIQNGYELDEIHDAKFTNLAAGDLLTRTANNLWENATRASLATDTAFTTRYISTGVGASTQIIYKNASNTPVGSPNLTFDGSTLSVFTGASTAVGFILKGAASQTANLQEWQNSAGTVLSRIDSSGNLRIKGISGDRGWLYPAADNTTAFLIADLPSATTKPLVIRGAVSQTADLQQWLDSSSTTLASVTSVGAVKSAAAGNAFGLVSGGAAWGGWTPVVEVRATNAAHSALNVFANGGPIMRAYDGSGNARGAWASDGSVVVGQSNTKIGTLSVYADAAGTIGAIIVGATGQTADLLSVRQTAGTALTGINSAGQVYIRTIGSNYGSSLNVATNNPVTIGTVIRGTTSQSADLLQLQDTAGTVLGGLNSNAQIFSGSTTPLSVAVGGATTATSGDGTTATITTTSTHGLAVGDMVVVAGITPTGYNGTFRVTAVPTTSSLSYANTTTGAQTVAGTVSAAAQTSITMRSAATAGLIIRIAGAAGSGLNPFVIQNSSGTSLAYFDNFGGLYAGGLGPVSQSGGFITTSSGATVLVRTNVTTVVPLTARGAASQTANLQEWQASDGTVLVGVNAAGDVHLGASTPYKSGILSIDQSKDINKPALVIRDGGTGAVNSFEHWSNNGITLQAAMNRTGDFIARSLATGTSRVVSFGSVSDANYYIYMPSNARAIIRSYYGSTIESGAAANTQLVVKGFNAQTANLQEWQNSAGTTISSVLSSGSIKINGSWGAPAIGTEGGPLILNNSSVGDSNSVSLLQGFDGASENIRITKGGGIRLNNISDISRTVTISAVPNSRWNVTGGMWFLTNGAGILLTSPSGTQKTLSVQDDGTFNTNIVPNASSWTDNTQTLLGTKTPGGSPRVSIKNFGNMTIDVQNINAADVAVWGALVPLTIRHDGVGTVTGDLFAAQLGANTLFNITKSGWVQIRDSTAPSSNPTTSGYLYVESGALKYRGSSGTITTLANA